MSSILGLTSGKTFADKGFYSLNDRRRVFREYPNGGAPLVGLLSLMDSEPTDNAKFGWFEKRFVQPESVLAVSGQETSPFWSAVGGTNYSTTQAFNGVENNTPHTRTVRVADSTNFRVSQVIMIRDVPQSNSAFVQIKGVITAVQTGLLTFQVLEDVTGVLCTTNLTTGGTKGPVGATVSVIGTANAENASSLGNGRFVVPVNPENYTQIFRTAYGFSATSLKMPANFDKTGIYREKAKDNCIDHMTEIEKAMLFGSKAISTATDVSGDTVPIRYTGGILWFLQEWERSGGGTTGYRPSGSAATLDSDDNKRIIENVSGTMTYATWNTYVERAFRVTNNKSSEKLVLCGSGALAAVNSLVELGLVTTNKNMGTESTYGMNLVTLETVFGVLHFKSHPLFNADPAWRYDALILDVQNLRYRPLNDRDTALLKNRQANDVDGRKDEWLSEVGLEVRFPESHMYIKNLRTITKS